MESIRGSFSTCRHTHLACRRESAVYTRCRLNDSTQPNGSKPEDICLACGLCCDGVIFADVKLQSGDRLEPFAACQSTQSPPEDAATERRLVPRSAARASFVVAQSNPRIGQPCIAFDGCKCRIYSQRPRHCRDFECLLLQSLKGGRTERSAALEIIRTARRRANKVWRLLRELGDTDEDLALSVRFRHTVRRMERGALDEQTAELYGELTLAVHDLNCLVSSAFYPG